MLRGSYQTRVDEKGRVKVPADFKRLMEEKYGQNRFYITSKDGVVAEIYPIEEWEKIEEKLAKMPSTSEAKRRFLNKVNYYGQEVEIDAQGRLLLPQTLRESAGLSGDVRVQGNLVYLEVLTEAKSEAGAKEEFSADDMKSLSDFGI